MQLDLVETQIARRRRLLSVRFRNHVKPLLSAHHNMFRPMQRRKRDPVWRVEAGLRRRKDPSPHAGIRPSRLDVDQKCEQQENTNGTSLNGSAQVLIKLHEHVRLGGSLYSARRACPSLSGKFAMLCSCPSFAEPDNFTDADLVMT